MSAFLIERRNETIESNEIDVMRVSSITIRPAFITSVKIANGTG